VAKVECVDQILRGLFEQRLAHGDRLNVGERQQPAAGIRFGDEK
jgi:hypothetical protein